MSVMYNTATMISTLLCLHGFSQNGDVLRAHMQPLLQRLPAAITTDFPDAPHTCSEQSVERLYKFMSGTRLPPPHRCFWDSTDDGRIYRGWEQTLELLHARVSALPQPVAVLGFSQGAIAAAALCALAARGEFPALHSAVLIAGRAPRADLLQPYFEQPLQIPSLHLWGERDAFAKLESPTLVERFDASKRVVATWSGPHVVPTRGAGADTIIAFVEAQLGSGAARGHIGG